MSLVFDRDTHVSDITRVVFRSMNREWSMLELASREDNLFAGNSFLIIDVLEGEGSGDTLWEGEDLS